MMDRIKTITKSESDTAAFAAGLAAGIRPDDAILLHGDLGSGKTVFARALIRELAGKAQLEVPSPTYTLAQIYDTDRNRIWHFDLYRIEKEGEIFELGWEEALERDIVLVEWPERLGPLMPRKRLDIVFSGVENEPDQRIIEVTRHD